MKKLRHNGKEYTFLRHSTAEYYIWVRTLEGTEIMVFNQWNI